ncbi:RAMP superfamily CRISPR-associated protein [Trichothermofontia sichuanensis B231]|uniref:RAMP superfamily CRISPR-associated protein n=1 Tax=Trichothermofontia sichuanensis TaxID=3045816 RepID=UPI002246C6A6|nr:RAMP superfamily CRISPR-associated protein [Trichothermofontia sichuanensis]UZQ56005.1 RAMP superfamily CRISPR-associated protein [Trichothermofontia sichuanensis B231]
MVFERPKRPGQAQPSPATQRPQTPGQRPAPPDRDPQRPTARQGGRGGDQGGGYRGGGRNPGGGQGGGGHDRPVPSPWLEHPLDPTPNPDATASFVEYLRWMRSPDSAYKDPTKVQILQIAEEQANYRDRLITLTNRTKLIAGEGNTFPAKCLWRIRVGGHRGPESILLPAFDALGMPYIPSSTLRGVARTQAIRELMAEQNLSWQQAEEVIARRYFGYLGSENREERSGKVIFLDAYPLPQQSGNGGGLAVDMANNIWSWDAAGRDLLYSPNPNPLFSLSETTFLIGIRPMPGSDPDIIDQVKQWLSRGLQAGIGSQVNTGYGSLVRAGHASAANEFFRVDFTLEGQLIHGRQKFTQWNWNDRRHEWQMRGNPDAEVRPVAFKSMLRYWFRALALGVLPSRDVQQLEGTLFGAITPRQSRGYLTVRITNGRVVQREARPNAQGKQDPCGEQSGTLILAHSTETPPEQHRTVATLCQNLTWLMFHLGGIGQGARRPCYSRQNRENGRAPWWRGSTLSPESDDGFWELPDTVQEFKKLFQRRLQDFYKALGKLTNQTINPNQLQRPGEVRKDKWTEAVDTNCQIVVCTGKSNFSKPYALAVLHSEELKKNGNYDPDLCGAVLGAKVKPSPVWIADLGDYQVVTVFGATQNPRQQYLNRLRQGCDCHQFAQIFPYN